MAPFFSIARFTQLVSTCRQPIRRRTGLERFEVLEQRLVLSFTPARPLLILPGVGATFIERQDTEAWYGQRGFDPEKLVIDPLTKVYDDLIETLTTAGYDQGKNLFVANYDWRLNPGPIDANARDEGVYDGKIEGLTTASLTDNKFEYGVDYLGYWLNQAETQWKATHPGAELPEVDVIAHSTGGLVTRSYMQSDAYPPITVDTTEEMAGYLPAIHNVVMVGVPNRGAPKAWNPMHDNWVVEPAFRVVLSKMLAKSWEQLQTTGVIHGGDYDIHLSDLTGSTEKQRKVQFIERYLPTARALLATFDFLRTSPDAALVDVNHDKTVRNNLLLDLNDGLDADYELNAYLRGLADNGVDYRAPDSSVTRTPNRFANLIQERQGLLTVIATSEGATPTVLEQVRREEARTGYEGLFDEVVTFTEFIGTAPSTTWYEERTANELPSRRDKHGDGTVPIESAHGQFVNKDGSLKKVHIDRRGLGADQLDHTGLMWNRAAQVAMLEGLGIPIPSNISDSRHVGSLTALYHTAELGIIDIGDLFNERMVGLLVKIGLPDLLRDFDEILVKVNQAIINDDETLPLTNVTLSEPAGKSHDGRITISEFPAASVDAEFIMRAEIVAGLQAKIGRADFPLPSLSSDFHLDWSLGQTPRIRWKPSNYCWVMTRRSLNSTSSRWSSVSNRQPSSR